jgi:hypothetical protein
MINREREYRIRASGGALSAPQYLQTSETFREPVSIARDDR